RVAGDVEVRAVVALDHGLGEAPARALQRRDLTEYEIDFALAGQRHHLVDAVGRGAELAPPVQQREMTRQRREVERPVERAVAAADDENAPAAERLHLPDRIEDRRALVGLDAGDRRTLGLERAAAGRHHDYLDLEHVAAIGRHAKARLADLLDGL